MHSLQFLKELLTLAREVVEAEQRVDPVDEQARAKAALTELFAEASRAGRARRRGSARFRRRSARWFTWTTRSRTKTSLIGRSVTLDSITEQSRSPTQSD
jgi:hypothetical protein